MPNNKLFTFCSVILMLALSQVSMAEETAAERAERELAEQMKNAPPEGEDVDITTLRRAKVTEEQAMAQLKYMVVEGWRRITDPLKERGSFKAFGLTLSPQGEFRPLFLDSQAALKQDVQIGAIVKNLEAIAQTRSVWAVGLMYVTGTVREDGTYSKRIAVVAEHIAGYARTWSYPYMVDESGEVKLGKALESEMDPIYFRAQ